MAKVPKVLSEDEIIKKEYSNFVEMNQYLKNICEIYYIGYNNIIYMKSLVPFIEKVAILNDKNMCSMYRGLLCLPNQIFEFKKEAKKSKLIVTQTENKIFLGQTENDELQITLNRGVPQNNNDTPNEVPFIQSNIVGNFYKKYFEIVDKIGVDNISFISIDSDKVDDLVSSKLVEMINGESYIPITRHLLLDLKKDDDLAIAKLPYVDKTKIGKVYYLLRNTNEYYTAYTLFAAMNHLSLV
jgi:hypothetical protein